MQTDGKLYVTTGRSRSGKTEITRRETANSPRLSVWDPKGQWAKKDRCERVTTRRELLRLMRNQAGPLRLAFVSPEPADFDFWAQATFWWSRLSAADCVAEEIANVTSPAKAPVGWHLLLSQGLEFGGDIHALTQRLSESDKTAVGNATLLRTFQLSRAKDRKYVAEEFDVPAEQVAALGHVEYLERDMRTGEVSKKRLNFARNSSDKGSPPIK